MRNGSYELRTTASVVSNIPEAAKVLRKNRIDSNNVTRLRTAAAAAGANPDELLALIETRLRRPAFHIEHHEEEDELAYA